MGVEGLGDSPCSVGAILGADDGLEQATPFATGVVTVLCRLVWLTVDLSVVLQVTRFCILAFIPDLLQGINAGCDAASESEAFRTVIVDDRN